MTSVSPRLRRAAAVIGVLPVIMLAASQGASFATPGGSPASESATPTVGIGGGNAGGGNVECPSGLLTYQLEDSPEPAKDTLKEGTSGDGTISVTISNLTATTFDFTANLVVDTLIVKGGSVDAVVTQPKSKAGSGNAPSDGDTDFGLSNITFCYAAPATPSPSPTTGTGGDDGDSGASPSPSPEVDQTTSPSPTPVTTPSTGTGGNNGDNNGGNEACPEGTVSLKIDSDELSDGTFISEDGQLIVKVDFNGLEDFSFTSNIPVTTVIVKGGPQAQVITFTGPTLSGTGLNAGLNPNSGQNYGLSNIQFCYVPRTATTTPSPSPTSGTGGGDGDSSPTPTPVVTPTASPTPAPNAGGGDTDTSPTPSPLLSPIGDTDDQPATGGQSPAPAPELSPITGGPVDQPAQQSPTPAAGGDAAPAAPGEQPDADQLPGEQITGTTDGQPATGPSQLPFTGLPTLGVLSAALTLLLAGGAITFAARRREDRAMHAA